MRILILSTLFIVQTACMSFSDRAMRPVAASIREQLPDITLDKEFAVAMGGGIFNFLDIVTLNDANLSEVDHLQVAVYKVAAHGRDVSFRDLNFEQTLMARDSSLHWEAIVKVNEDDEKVWVFVGMDLERNTLDAVSVFALDRDELVLINMGGDFNDMLEYALEPARGHRGVYSSG